MTLIPWNLDAEVESSKKIFLRTNKFDPKEIIKTNSRVRIKDGE